jgi:hypothetical protein
MSEQPSTSQLLAAFRYQYHQFTEAVTGVVSDEEDPTVIARLGDELDEYVGLVDGVSDQSVAYATY